MPSPLATYLRYLDCSFGNVAYASPGWQTSRQTNKQRHKQTSQANIWQMTTPLANDVANKMTKNYNCVLRLALVFLSLSLTPSLSHSPCFGVYFLFVLCHAEESVRFYYHFVTCVFTANNNNKTLAFTTSARWLTACVCVPEPGSLCIFAVGIRRTLRIRDVWLSCYQAFCCWYCIAHEIEILLSNLAQKLGFFFSSFFWLLKCQSLIYLLFLLIIKHISRETLTSTNW